MRICLYISQSGWGVNPSQEVVDEIEEIFKTRRLDTLAVEDMTPLQVALAKGSVHNMLLVLTALT